MTLKDSLKSLRSYLFWHGWLYLREGSASLEELEYLSGLIQDRNAKSIGEIGFNAGFSSLAFLSAHPETHVTSFDIGDHGYTKTAKQYIDKHFPGRHTIIWGDSKVTVPQFQKDNPDTVFDLIFIDGGHDFPTAKADIINMKSLATPQTAVIIDDLTPWLAWGKGPTRAWTEAIREGVVIQKALYKDGRLVDWIQPPGDRSWALGFYLLE